jgi:hypothetical protein
MQETFLLADLIEPLPRCAQPTGVDIFERIACPFVMAWILESSDSTAGLA